jgi:hypothetical protein
MRRLTFKRGNLQEQTIRRVFAALDEGGTITTMTGGAKALGLKKIIGYQRLAGLHVSQPKLGRLIWKRSAENAKRKVRERYSLVRVSVPAIVSARSLDIWTMIRAAVPAWWGEEKREEVISRLATAVCEGRVKPHQIREAVHTMATAHDRMFTQYAMGGGAGKWRSIDAPLREDGSMTLSDLVSDGLWS